MAGNQSIIEPLIEKIEAYGNTSIDLIKLKSIDQVAKCTSTFGSRIIALLFISMFIIIASIGLALYLGEQMDRVYYGFFMVAGVYGILGIVLYFIVHKWIKKCIGDAIISQLLN